MECQEKIKPLAEKSPGFMIDGHSYRGVKRKSDFFLDPHQPGTGLHQRRNLWKERGNYSFFVEACAGDAPLAATLSKSCDGYLKANPKAAEQWRHEGRLAEFESRKWQ